MIGILRAVTIMALLYGVAAVVFLALPAMTTAATTGHARPVACAAMRFAACADLDPSTVDDLRAVA